MPLICCYLEWLLLTRIPLEIHPSHTLLLFFVKPFSNLWLNKGFGWILKYSYPNSVNHIVGKSEKEKMSNLR